MLRSPSRPIQSYFALILALAVPGKAAALGLGPVAGEPIIGEPLAITIPLTGGLDRPFDNNCIILSRPGNSLEADYFPRDLSSRIETGDSGKIIAVTTRTALRQPIVEFRLTVTCGYNLSHEYTFMASPRTVAAAAAPRPAPSAVVGGPPSAAPVATGRAGLPDGLSGHTITLERDLLLEDLARQYFPGPLRQERFARWVAEANPALFAGAGDPRRQRLAAGTSLTIPDGVPPRRPGDHQQAARPATQTANPATAEATSAPPPKAARPETRDRLVIGAGSGKFDAKEAEAMVGRLTDMLEKQVAHQAEYEERLQNLETTLNQVTQQLRQVESDARQREALWKKEREEERQRLSQESRLEWLQLFLAIVCGGAAVALALFGQRRLAARRAAADPGPATAAVVDMATPSPAQPLPPSWDEMLAEQPDSPSAPAAESGPAPSARPAPAIPAHERHGSPPSRYVTPLDYSIDFEPPGKTMAPAKPISVIPEPSDPAAAAIELADIMISMGLAESAAQTLVEHIRENPRQSLHQWLKLLELHRMTDNRNGFETSVSELRQHFNIEATAWESAAALGTRNSLEEYTHLRNHLIDIWRQPGCADFLQGLLIDNREGTRTGFPLSVAEEILLLLAVLNYS